MLTDIKKLEDFQAKRKGMRGNELNRNYWANCLADAFPEVIERRNGEVTVIEFMGIKFVRSE
jgi:hypothetical protein